MEENKTFSDLLKDVKQMMLITKDENSINALQQNDHGERSLDAIWNMVDERLESVYKKPENFVVHATLQMRFPELSPINIMLLQSQNINVSDIAEYDEWKRMGVFVRRNETALRVLRRDQRKTQDNSNQWTTRPVFDIKQTTLFDNTSLKDDQQEPLFVPATQDTNRSIVIDFASSDIPSGTLYNDVYLTWDAKNILKTLLYDNPAPIVFDKNPDIKNMVYKNGKIVVNSIFAESPNINTNMDFIFLICKCTIEAYWDKNNQNTKSKSSVKTTSKTYSSLSKLSTYMALRGMGAVLDARYLASVYKDPEVSALNAMGKRNLLSQARAAALNVIDQAERAGWETMRSKRYTWQYKDKLRKRNLQEPER